MINLTEVSYQLPAMKSEVVAVGGVAALSNLKKQPSSWLLAPPSYRRL